MDHVQFSLFMPYRCYFEMYVVVVISAIALTSKTILPRILSWRNIYLSLLFRHPKIYYQKLNNVLRFYQKNLNVAYSKQIEREKNRLFHSNCY